MSEQLHDMQLQAERLEAICEAAKARPLTNDEVLDLLIGLGLLPNRNFKQESFDGFDGF